MATDNEFQDIDFYEDSTQPTHCGNCGRRLEPGSGGMCSCDECGMTRGGYCTLTGTEFCDFECPFRRQGGKT